MTNTPSVKAGTGGGQEPPALLAAWGDDEEGSRLHGRLPGESEFWTVSEGRAARVATVTVTENDTRHSTRITWVDQGREWPQYRRDACETRLYVAVGKLLRARARS